MTNDKQNPELKAAGSKNKIRHIVGDCVMPREGIFTKVLKGGKIKADDKIEIVEK